MCQRSLEPGMIAQQVKTLVFKPDNLRSIPGTHLVEGENRLNHGVL